MKYQEQSIAENSLYKIDRIDQLAIIRFKADSPLEDLYNVENSNQYFGEGLEKIIGKDISTRLFIFSNNIFAEEQFNEFFKTIKIEENEKVDFLSSETNIRLNTLARFTNINSLLLKTIFYLWEVWSIIWINMLRKRHWMNCYYSVNRYRQRIWIVGASLIEYYLKKVNLSRKLLKLLWIYQKNHTFI